MNLILFWPSSSDPERAIHLPQGESLDRGLLLVVFALRCRELCLQIQPTQNAHVFAILALPSAIETFRIMRTIAAVSLSNPSPELAALRSAGQKAHGSDMHLCMRPNGICTHRADQRSQISLSITGTARRTVTRKRSFSFHPTRRSGTSSCTIAASEMRDSRRAWSARCCSPPRRGNHSGSGLPPPLAGRRGAPPR